MSLFRMLAEDSSELLRPQTVATYHVVRVVIDHYYTIMFIKQSP